MSYIKIGEHGFKFNELAIRKFSEIVLQDMALGLTEDEIKASSVYAMLWGGLHGNAYVKREPMTMTFEQVCDLAESMSKEDLKSISAVFTETQSYKDLLKDLNPPKEVVKKKTQRQKQK